MQKHLKIATFNTLGTPFFAPYIKQRYQAIADIAIKEELDILCLQEISSFYNLKHMQKYLGNIYPYHAYKYHLLGPKGGLVLFSKIPITSHTYYTYATLGSIKNITFYTKIIRNGILSCTFKDLALTVMNTHTVSDFEFDETIGNTFHPFVKGQVMEAAKNVNAIKKNAVLLMGDFNMAKDTNLYTSFLKISGMQDAMSNSALATYDPKRINYRFIGSHKAIIDFIFLKQNMQKFDKIHTGHIFEKKVTLSNQKESYLSDHVGLQISFSLG